MSNSSWWLFSGILPAAVFVQSSRQCRFHEGNERIHHPLPRLYGPLAGGLLLNLHPCEVHLYTGMITVAESMNGRHQNHELFLSPWQSQSLPYCSDAVCVWGGGADIPISVGVVTLFGGEGMYVTWGRATWVKQNVLFHSPQWNGTLGKIQKCMGSLAKFSIPLPHPLME